MNDGCPYKVKDIKPQNSTLPVNDINIPVSVLFENINYRRRVYSVAIIKFLNIQFIPIISVYHLRQTNFENDNFTCFYFLNNLSL